MYRSVAVVVLYLAGITAGLSTFVTSCTAEGVQALITSGLRGVLLYLFAIVPLVSRPLPHRVRFVLAPALIPAAYLAWWSGRLTLGYWYAGHTLCYLVTGVDQPSDTNNEAGLIVLLYGTMSLIALLGIGLSWRRAGHEAHGSPHARALQNP
jgi:hypothetical protein